MTFPIIYSFPNISPINTIEEAIKRGHYKNYFRFISTVKIEPAECPKQLHLVCFNRSVDETEYVELLASLGMQPCRKAPAYLAGLMAVISEERMPEELRNKNLVAAEPNNVSSIFIGEYGSRCFLYADRFDGDRTLDLTSVDRFWQGYWAFLTEDLPNKS